MWSIPQLPVDLVTFTEEIPNGKIYFFCSVVQTHYVPVVLSQRQFFTFYRTYSDP